MALNNISISAVRFNNEPFVRSLTATLLNNNTVATGSHLIQWSYPLTNTLATNITGGLYNPGIPQPVSAVGTLVFNVSTTTYDVITESFTLCAIDIGCRSLNTNLQTIATTNFTLSVDTFPNVDFTLFANFENTNEQTLFYRLTSTTPWTTKIRFESEFYNLIDVLSSEFHQVHYYLNDNTSTKYIEPSSTFNFVRTNSGLTKRLSSINAVLSAYSAPNSLSSWYTPHIITKSLTAGFVPYFLSAGDFVAFPLSYFERSLFQPLLTSSYEDFFTTSPGLCFYGEGHTERINLSAQNSNNNLTYTWRVNDGGEALYTAYPNLQNNNKHLGYILLSTVPSQDSSFPLSLQVSDNLLTSNEPRIYNDDESGVEVYYPYYTSTQTPQGFPSTTSSFFQNIRVRPYLTTYIPRLNTGVPNNGPVIFLPPNKLPVDLTASWDVVLSELEKCQDKYDFIWQWDALRNFSVLRGTYEMGYLSSGDVAPADLIEIQLKTGFDFGNFDFAKQYILPEAPVRLVFRNSTPYSGITDMPSLSDTPPLSGNYFIDYATPESFFFEVSTSVKRAISGEVIAAFPIGPATLSQIASSWDTTQCETTSLLPNFNFITNYPTGLYPKRWRNEGVEDPTRFFPGVYEYESIFWDLSASTVLKEWSDPQVISPSAVKTYTYSLKLSEFGGNSEEMGSFATSFFSDTKVFLGAQQTITCQITSGNYNPLTFEYLSAGDWPPRTETVAAQRDYISFEPPLISLYTPNRYIEVGALSRIQNNSLRLTRAVTAVDVQLDDIAGETIFLTGANVSNDYLISYTTIGSKTISIIGYPRFYIGPFVTTYPNLLEVVETYDQIFPAAYFTRESILNNLPWKESPTIGSNDWVIADTINTCIKMFDDNLRYLNDRNQVYLDKPNDYFGWLGPQPTVIQNITACPLWTWEDLDCSSPDNEYNLNWTTVMSAGVVSDITKTGEFATCGTWTQHACPADLITPTCLQKHCVEWSWVSRLSAETETPITWRESKLSGLYPKRWYYEPCENVENINCDQGVWNVNIPNLDRFYDPIPECFSQGRCKYRGITSFNNILYTALGTQVRLLSSDQQATYFDLQYFSDGATPFVDIVGIALDSKKKIYILDKTLSKIAVYLYRENKRAEKWSLFTNWGGFGGSSSTIAFNNPTDLHIDQYDTVWVVDAGNSVIKHFTNTGAWIKTVRDTEFTKEPLISVCVDSSNNLHVATTKRIRVYSYEGVFLFEYIPDPSKFRGNIVKIKNNYNREVVYIASRTTVIRHFKNGEYSGSILDSKQCVTNITDIYHDEFRNLLVASDNKILKYSDLMTIIPLKGKLPETFWSLKDLYIHEEEYVQNWVYTKSLQRLWDNIETFRNTLFYKDRDCLRYTPPIYSKDKITIGQNEIVTSTVINRVLGYLWENYQTLLKYFDPNCDLT